MPQRTLAPAAVAALLLLTATAVPAEPAGKMKPEQGWASIARCAQEDSERARHTCMDGVLREAGLLTAEMHARQQRRAFGLEDTPSRTLPPPPSVAPTTGGTAPAATAATAESSATTARSASRPTDASSSTAAGETPATPAASGAQTQSVRPSSASTAGAATAEPSSTASAGAATTAPPDHLDVELTAVEKAANGRLFVTTSDGAVWLQTETVDMPQPPTAGDRMIIRKGSMGGYRCSVTSTHLTYRCIRNR